MDEARAMVSDGINVLAGTVSPATLAQYIRNDDGIYGCPSGSERAFTHEMLNLRPLDSWPAARGAGAVKGRHFGIPRPAKEPPFHRAHRESTRPSHRRRPDRRRALANPAATASARQATPPWWVTPTPRARLEWP